MRLQPRNPMGKVMISILAFEAISFGLAIAGMIQVDNVPVNVAVTTACIGIAFALVSLALLRRPIGYLLGWVTQVIGLAMGLLTPWMYWVGGMFALLWVVSFVLGRRIETAGGSKPASDA